MRPAKHETRSHRLLYPFTATSAYEQNLHLIENERLELIQQSNMNYIKPINAVCTMHHVHITIY